MELTEQEIKEMYRDFSAKFSNHLMRFLIENTGNDENVSVSPSRLQTVMTLLANWASQDVQRAILDVIGSDVMDIREANILCDKEQFKLTPWEKDCGNSHIPSIELSTILWLMRGLVVDKQALEKVSTFIDVSSETVDFSLPDTKAIINKAIDKASHGLIKELSVGIGPDTKALITDILYFKAQWAEKFDELATKEQLFYGTKGKVSVPMMKRKGFMFYGETAICQMVSIRYMCMSEQDKSFVMRIYLPKKGHTPDEVLRELWDNDFFIDGEEEEVKLTLPKFTTESKVNLKETLLQLGLGCVFESEDIIPNCVKNLMISDITQQVKIKVNENETEAAALTELVMALGAPPPIEEKPVVMTVNRPFLFEIAEEYSNTILFVGLINNIEEE